MQERAATTEKEEDYPSIWCVTVLHRQQGALRSLDGSSPEQVFVQSPQASSFPQDFIYLATDVFSLSLTQNSSKFSTVSLLLCRLGEH